MAPGLTALYVYVGSTDTAILSSMSTHSPLSAQLSSSWTWSPSDPSTDDPYFEKFAAQGQSFFQAAGDSAAYTSSSQEVYPANDAYVTVVGGTDLNTSGPGGAWVSETAWADGGGGYFTPDAIPIPSWQQPAGVITPVNGGSSTLRNSPDVAAESNFDFYVCADQSGCTANEYGGTSFAAPMWAGYLALANQQSVANGNSTVGFINPAIYSIGLGTCYDTDFHDVTQGSNGYPAEIGYDLATGWGSPNGAGLINALTQASASANFTVCASPTSVSVVRGSNGTSAITTAVLNGFDSAIALSATGQPAGVTVTFNPTSIAAPGAGTSTMTMAAASTAATGTDTITVTGASGSLQHSASITLFVDDFSVSVTPASETVTAGNGTSYTAAVGALNGFTGTVTLSASGLPSGASASFSVNPITGGSGSATLSVSTGSATPGTYTLTVSGSSGGTNHSASVSLVIVPPPIAVTVTPSTTTLAPGQTQQFTAKVVNTTNTAVTWALNPNVGTVSSTGLYTPPSTISTQQAVTVTATSVADTTKTGSASIVLIPPAAWNNTSWTNRKTITINRAEVSGTSSLVNFPVLVSVTDANLATVANGGNVGKPDGSDILFTASDGATQLAYEMESYNGSTGQVIAWVNVPALSPAADTVLYVYYGNPAAANQQNAAGVWNSNYEGVWHLPNGSVLSGNDSTANGNNALSLNGTSAAAGEIDGAASWNGSSNFIQVPGSTSLDGWTQQTVSLWMKAQTGMTANARLIEKGANNEWTLAFNYVGANELTLQNLGANSPAITTSVAVADNTWHKIDATMDNNSKAIAIYVDGVLNVSGTFGQLGFDHQQRPLHRKVRRRRVLLSGADGRSPDLEHAAVGGLDRHRVQQ